MLTRKGFKSSTGRSVVLATVAAMALTAAGPSFAASPAPVGKVVSAHAITDFSAARRHHRHRGGGNAAAAAAFAGIIGTVGAIAAANARDNAYDYYGGPVYYGTPYYGYPDYRYTTPYGGAPYGGAPYGGHGTYLDPGGNIIPY